jgi:tRNA A37 N6-isopentenylltransferase MiaA
MQAAGYKEVIDYLEGRIKSIEELAEKIYLSHRQYAKRQITWFEGKGRGYHLVKVNESNIEGIVRNFISE